MASTDDYVGLITSQHRNQPFFAAVIAALTEALAETVNANLAMVDAFDLDQARGAQLDSIGLWVGIGRKVATPLTGVYFTWNDTAATGWNFGSWKGPFDPVTGLVSLDDATYRTLIRAKIAANHWDGTLAGMYEWLGYVFGAGVVTVQDDQNMEITLIYDDLQLTTVLKELLVSGAFPLKPAGVRVNYTALSGDPIFAWNRSTPKFQGWDVGHWT